MRGAGLRLVVLALWLSWAVALTGLAQDAVGSSVESQLKRDEVALKAGHPDGSSRERKSAEPARLKAARRFLARRGLRTGKIPGLKSETWGSRIASAYPHGVQGQQRILRFAQDDKSSSISRGTTDFISAEAAQAAGVPAWTAVGPVGVNSLSYGVVTGRVSALALDPADGVGNHLFVGTTGGGLWASQNAAASSGTVQFVPVTDGLAALTGVAQAGVSVGAVSVQPGGTGVVLAGLGDPNDALDSYYGAGLLRSADGGKTWTLIQQTVDLESGFSTQDYSFEGEGFAGFAWSTTNVQLVVAAVSQAYEGTLVNAGLTARSMEGLYYSQDSGATWHLARITDLNGQDVQGPADGFALPDGNAATAVVWNPLRQVFVAAVRFHGYYQSADGVTWTRMADFPAGQPGTGLTAANCPTESGSVGVAGCPIFRGALAVNPSTGDTFAWTVDASNQDQGIWQDQCGLTGSGGGSACTNQTMTFGVRLGTTALEVADGNGAATIENGDYNLTLAAVPGGLGTGQDTLLFAGANDLWKCSLANSCVWRNTTNSTSCMSAKVGEYQHAVAWDAGNPLLVYVGNDNGLWRSTDQVGETGSVCATTDAAHWQNLNPGLGSLAEVVSLGQSASTAATMLAGMGTNGFAGVMNAPATPGNWSEVLGGEGGPVAVDQTSHVNSWYANNEAGVSIYHCNSSTLCTPTAFGAGGGPVIGETQVAEDGVTMPYPAEFRLDAADPTQVLVGTCRVWRGPATGAGWSGTNAISPILDGTSSTGGGSFCDGNGLIRTIAALPTTGGGEAIYVGMAGAQDGGGVVAGHVFGAVISAAGTVSGWTDLAFSPVTNSGLAFNAFGEDVSGLYVDPHDATGGTVYAAISGFSSVAEPSQTVYRTTDGGMHWVAITSNLPNSPANAVVVDAEDANTVYVATDVGVYVTRSVGSCGGGGGNCWSVYGTGLPLAPVTTLVTTPASGAAGQVLTAGTYGRGIWQIPAVTAGVTLTTATLSPGTLTFTGQTVGTASAAQTVTVKATGTASLTITGIAASGAAAADFGETDTCVGVALVKNASCTVKVTFTPTQTGSRPGTLAIQANVAGGQLLASLNGTGLATADVTLLPTSLAFGTVQVGKVSATQTLNLQNVGGSSVTISSITATAPFVKGTSTCGGSLASGVGCAVTVSFAPTQAGAATGTFTVVDSVGTQSAVLSGTGVSGATDTLSATSLSFPGTVVGQSATPFTVQITNSGGLPLTGIGTSVASSFPKDFTAVSDCGSTLGAGASCGVTVTFQPSAATTEYGTLTISDALRAQSVALSGVGRKPPVLAITPTTVSFGSSQVGVASAAKTVTITNTGGSPLSSPGFALSGTGVGSFSIGATTCGSSLAAAATCTVQVTFTPVASGTATATLTASTSSLGVAAVSTALSGTGLTPPILAVSPAAINAGPVVLGNSSGAFSVQVTNSGQVAMTGLGFAISGISGPSGAQLADFSLSAPGDITACGFTGATLNPGASCYMQVVFSPSVIGVESATLTVTSANAIPGAATVSLTGTGTPVILLQANPQQENFPATAVGAISGSQTLTISNLGKQSANGLTLAVTGPYSQVPTLTTCKGKLSAGAFCTVGLTFAPIASGDQPGTLTATVTNLGVATLTVPLDGTGLAVGGIAVSATQMTFGSVVVGTASAVQTLTVTNTGQAVLTGVSVTSSANYSLTGNTCSGKLGVGASCTTGLVFKPSTIGNQIGTLTVSSTSIEVPPAIVGLTGNGILAGSLSANPAVLSFGGVTVGQTGPAQSVVLTNAGATVLSGLRFQVTGDYSLTANGCGTQLASGATCSLTATFSPAAPGTRNGAVNIGSTNSGFTTFVIGLTGTGLAAARMVVSPGQLNFGSVTVGSNSTALQLTVTNPGTGILTGLAFTTALPFSVGSGSCGPNLLPGGSCGVPVTYSPIAGGSASGTVMVSSTSLGVPAVTISVGGTGVAPASLQMNPPAVTFAGTTIGVKSVGQTVTVTNPGGVALNGLKLGISGTGAGDFAFQASTGSAGCASALASGASCSVLVNFLPTVAGGRAAFLTASSTTAGVAPASAILSGTGLTPATLGLTPTQLTFGKTLLGQASAAQMVTVKNSGGTGITDLQLGVTAGFVVDFATTTCKGVLGAGASCQAGVVFSPTAGGAETGSLTANSVAGSTAGTAALSGIGALPPGVVTVPAALVQFGTTGVGQAGTPVTVTLTNPGSLSALTGLVLSIDTTGLASGFGLSSNTCTATLAAGASCTVNVTFVPTSARVLTGSLLVTSANGGSGGGQGTVNLALAGVGYDFKLLVVGSSSMTVVQGQTAYYTLSVTAQGSASGAVSFQCVKVPTNALCLFNPPQLNGLPTNVAGNVRLGIATGAATKANLPQERGNSSWRRTAVLACGLVALPLLWRRRRLGTSRLCTTMMLAGILWGFAGCAGSGGSGKQSHLGGGTPTGSYKMTVNATSAGVTHSTTVTVVVN